MQRVFRTKRNSATWFPLLALALLLAASMNLAAQQAKHAVEVQMRMDQKVRMSDGVELSANVFLPAGSKQQPGQPSPRRLPTILGFTPYLLDQRYQDGVWFAKRGYNFIRADVRGRGNSGGDFYPNEDIGKDGAELIAWIARQPWSDGQVAMFGGSYEGLTQWQTVKEHPPALKTIVPMAAAYPGPMSTFLAYQMQWLASVTGRTSQLQLFLDFDYWNPHYYRRYAGHIPWAQLAELTDSDTRTWARWIAHPTRDAYWEAMVPSPHQYANIDIPVLTVTSYYDLAQSGALQFYRNHMEHGSEKAKAQHHILMGPWSHGGTMRPTQTLSGLDFGPESVPHEDFKELAVKWYDWVMKGGPKPEFLNSKITYYAVGENAWKEAGELDDIATGTATWYLESADSPATDVFHSGTLQSAKVSGQQQPDEFVYNPLDLISAQEYFARPPNILNPNWLMDGSGAYAKNILIYHTPPLEQDLELAGSPVFRAYIELNVPDTDFQVRLFEIAPDGTAIWLGETFLRARHRHSMVEPELVKPGAVERYEFDGFLFMVRRIPKGSRLQLVLNGLNHPNYQKNYNSGGDVNQETAKDAHTAVVRLHHDERYPSALVLPIRSAAPGQTQ